MTAWLFLGFLAACGAAVVGMAWRSLGRGAAAAVAVGLPLWLLYAGWIGRSGVLAAVPGRPPGLLLLVGPAVLFVIVVARSRAGERAAQAIPLGVLIGAQVFRIGVELFLHQLALEGLSPRMLTFEGANVDLWIGLSAPVVAWLAARRSIGARRVLVWNGLGLLSLANVVVRSILTAPGPLGLLHTDVPNLFVSTFPYSFIPAFFVPLAVVLHVLTIRRMVATGAAVRPRSAARTAIRG